MKNRLDYYKESPQGVKALGEVYNYVMSSGLEKELIELVFLRVSQINNCAFCLDMHTNSLLKMGVSTQKLALLQAWHEAGDMFSSKEKAALSWSESVTNVAQTAVPDFEFENIKKVFNDKEIADLTIAIGLMNAYNRLAISFRNIPESVKNLK